jgi:hypothetical protein
MSLEDEVTASSIAAEIILLRAAARKTILIVEGGTDERLLSVFVDSAECDIVISYGKENALKALAIARHKNITGLLCILDRDYLEYLSGLPDDKDIIFTDEHDIEMMLIKSFAFDRLLAEMGSQEKLQEILGRGSNPRQIIRDTAHHIGIFRLLSLRDGLNLTFHKLRYSFVHRASLSIDLSEMIDEVFNSSLRRCEDKAALMRAIEDWNAKPHDPWLICSGHDLTAILGKALLSLFGSHSTQAIRRDEIESKLRMAFSAEDLRATNLFIAVVQWEQANPPFLVWHQAIRVTAQRR